MLHLLYALLATATSSLKPQRELALENLALRQQLAVVQRKTKRPKLTKVDRAFWAALCRLWPDWQNALIIVKPQTVIGWHRKGFKLYWTWKSRKRTGRPLIDSKIRTLIRRIASESCAHCARPRRMPRSIRDCRTVGNAPRGPSSVRWVTFAIIAAHVSRRTRF